MSFAALVAAADPVYGGLALSVPETWHQGRTAYGGFSSALALSAAMRLADDLPPLRSAQLSMIAPLAGRVEARARIVRRGRNATWVAAEISGEAGVGFIASFVFMGPVASTLHLNEHVLPEGLIAVDAAENFAFRQHSPAFLRNHFEVRFALPRGEDKQPQMCWWVRLAERAGLDPMVELMLCADGLPPGVMPLLSPGVPVSTMHWQVNLLTPAPATDDGWWLLRSRGDYAENGCSSQRMDLWNARGEAILAGMQSIALFG